MLTALPGLARGVQDGIGARYEGEHPSEWIAAGWSVSAGRFMAYQIASRDGFRLETLPDGGYFSPAPPGYHPPKVERAPDDATWAKLAELQVEQVNRESGNFTTGGDLIMTRIERSGITSRKIARFSNHGAAAAAMEGQHAT